jgi:hypothetical protein
MMSSGMSQPDAIATGTTMKTPLIVVHSGFETSGCDTHIRRFIPEDILEPSIFIEAFALI